MEKSLQEKRSDLEKLLTEIQAYEDESKKDGFVAEPKKAEAIDAKAEEAMALQKELDAAVKGAEARQKALNWRGLESTLPPDHQPDNVVKTAPEEIVGYMRIGDYVIAQGALAEYIKAGRPDAKFKLADIPGSILRNPKEREAFVPLTRKQVNAIYERKAVPVIGAGIIQPQRIPGIVRATEFDRLVLRDVLNIGTTNSNAVDWVRETAFERGADTVAEGARKPEAAKDYEDVVSPVRTIAVWMPVNNQQLDDWPALQGDINTNLLYDLEKRVEELVTWGSGVNEFLGFFNDPQIWACGQMDAAGNVTRVVAGEPLIDTIRRGITDVRVAGYEPNGVLVHPYDWETIQLTKTTTNAYVYVIVTEAGISRLWGVPVIETVACENFTGALEEERNLLVGDFTRGATLWDRMQSQVSIGWINEQFIHNQKTILAELRAAWAIRAPKAFRDFQAHAAVES